MRLSQSKVLALVTCGILLGGSVFSQQEKKHPIDKAYEACMEKNSSTAGMRECAEQAEKAWDKEMNRVYEKLRARLDEKGKSALKAAQLKWIAYRDEEYKQLDSLYSGLQGTMYIPMHAYARTHIVRERTLQLTGYLELLDEAGK